ncbi:MAG: hypothetical protein AABN33_00330 [Acidobacteriota bacterium]
MLRYLIHNWERKLSRKDNNRIVRPFDYGTESLEPRQFTEPSIDNEADQLDAIFRFNEQAISGSDQFFSWESVPTFSVEDGWLTFQSAVKTPFVENNTAYARYFSVSGQAGSLNGSRADEIARARGRAVVVLPHWNAKAQEHVALCELLNRTGIAALRLSLPYHDRRMLPGFERADYMVSANLGRTLQANRQAVLDTRAAVHWLEAQGYDRIGIVGTSLGSCIAFLTFVHEQRIRVGVYNHVSSYFGDVVWEGLTTAHVRRGLEAAITRDEVRRAWLAISPNSYAGKLVGDERRGLMISARYDLSFTPELSRLLFQECDRHGVKLDRAIVRCGHYSLGRAPYKYYAGYLLANYFRRNL